MSLLVNTGGYRHNGQVVPGDSRCGVAYAEACRAAKKKLTKSKSKSRRRKSNALPKRP